MKAKMLTSPPSRRSFPRRSPSTVLANIKLLKKRSPKSSNSQPMMIDIGAVKYAFELVSQAVVLFISTDLDDVFVLLGFFADPRFRIRQIVAGQFIGIAALYALSVVGSLVSL